MALNLIEKVAVTVAPAAAVSRKRSWSASNRDKLHADSTSRHWQDDKRTSGSGSGSKMADTGAPAAADGPPAEATNGKLEAAVGVTCMPVAATQSVAGRVEEHTREAAAAMAVGAMPGGADTATK
jgi:hypothetical protein